MKKCIFIVDLGVGNVLSLARIVENLGFEVKIGKAPDKTEYCNFVILPGVGNFGEYMKRVTNFGVQEFLHNHVLSGRYLLGICVGAQALFESSDESLGQKGMGLLDGRVAKLDFSMASNVPRIGWDYIFDANQLPNVNWENQNRVYFSHSFYFEPEDKKIVTHFTGVNLNIPAAIRKNNIFGFQFHPEKSHAYGIKMLERCISESYKNDH